MCIKALPPVPGSSIDLMVWLHWPWLLGQNSQSTNAHWWQHTPRGAFCLAESWEAYIVKHRAYCKPKAAAFRDELRSPCTLAGRISIPGSSAPGGAYDLNQGPSPEKALAEITQAWHKELANGRLSEKDPFLLPWTLQLGRGQKIQRSWITRALLTFGMVRVMEPHRSAFLKPFPLLRADTIEHAWTVKYLAFPISPTHPRLLVLTICRC